MFSKAKRFEPAAPVKNIANVAKKPEIESQKSKIKVPPAPLGSGCKSKVKPATTPLKTNSDAHSQCSSVKSVKSFTTPKPVKPLTKPPTSLKKPLPLSSKGQKPKSTTQDDILKDQEVEIRNKDQTISEYTRQIEELRNEIATLQKQLHEANANEADGLDTKLSKISLEDTKAKQEEFENHVTGLKQKIMELEKLCERLEEEVSSKQVELTALEETITIRDTLCKDLQDKLTNMETCMEETRQRLEMVKGHHALALEANESIRREYKAELETVKAKFEEEKQNIIAKSKADQEAIKLKYISMMESNKDQIIKEKEDAVADLQKQLVNKELEMKAKLEQIDEATHEKLRICEIQFEERTRNIQDHWALQQEKLQYLETEVKDLKYTLCITEEQNEKLKKEINSLKPEVEVLRAEKLKLVEEVDELKEESKRKLIDFENQINKLTLEADKAVKEKNKFEMSLSVTRDIVQVLTMRLRESDNELELLENKVQALTNAKEALEDEVATYKNSLNNTVSECNEYKEALVNILKSKAALAKEHTRIMEHNVTLIESLQNVEKEAYRELGSIKNELIEDVELLKKESNSQIKMLREEVEKKSMLCTLATEQAGHAAAAAGQARELVARAAQDIARLEADNQRLQAQIQDQQSLVVELSLLRQENEELTMAVAKQSSVVDKMKKDAEQNLAKPKSPSIMRKNYKSGKENVQQITVSPLRERNQMV